MSQLLHQILYTKYYLILETAITSYHKHPTDSFHTGTHSTSNPDIKKKYPSAYCTGTHVPSNCTVIADPKKYIEISSQNNYISASTA